MNRHLLVMNVWMFSHKTFFLKNASDNLKNRCHFKFILGHAAFQLLSELTFFLKFSLLLLGNQKTLASIKIWVTVDY